MDFEFDFLGWDPIWFDKSLKEILGIYFSNEYELFLDRYYYHRFVAVMLTPELLLPSLGNAHKLYIKLFIIITD